MMPLTANRMPKGRKEQKELLAALQQALSEMEQKLADFSVPGDPELEQGLKRLIQAGGKRLRPSLAWVCYRMGEEPKLPILPLMCMIEWMHTASLIHDDVVDRAKTRRGVPALHTQFGEKRALAAGDLLLAQAMKELHIYRGTGINEALAEVSMHMCSGEFQQMRNRYRADRQSIEVYEKQIRNKTAYLIATACFAGAAAGGLSEKQTGALRAYGERIGTAFQLKDDLLDFTADADFGKKRGQDLISGIYTLPFLYACSDRPDASMLALAQKKEKSEKEVQTLISWTVEAGGIARTEERIREVSKEAVRCLDVLPESPCREALKSIALVLKERTT